MTRIVTRLDEISERYDVLFCDLWGCVHDGLTPFPGAIEALLRFRDKGGAVILITNAPRQRPEIAAQLDAMGLPRAAWDDIASSGDAARVAMFRGAVGQKLWFMGEDRDRVFFRPTKLVDNPVAVTEVPLEEAEGIVCCGPFDPLADPAELRPQLLYAKTKGLKLLCANPDIVVDKGEVREWCAGEVARRYTEMGGTSLFFGKPHPPIYDLARLRLGALGRGLDEKRILAIGDGIGTDIAGAMGEDFDSLFITGGLAAEETGTGPGPDGQPDPDRLSAYLEKAVLSPGFAAGFLR